MNIIPRRHKKLRCPATLLNAKKEKYRAVYAMAQASHCRILLVQLVMAVVNWIVLFAVVCQLFSSEKLNKTHNYFFMNIIPQLHLYQNKNRYSAGKVTLYIFFVSRCAATCINTKNDEVSPQHFAQNNYMSGKSNTI